VRMADALLVKTLVMILASVCAVGLLARMRLPAPVGYLVAGLVIGPHGLQLIAASDEVRFLAELGIIFLMFTVGLESSLPTMIAARRDVFGAGSLQVGLTILMVVGAATMWGLSPPVALLLGGAVAMSSTAITLKQLADLGEMSSQHGRLTFGILLFQDLATLPFLVMVGAWEQSSGTEPFAFLRQLLIAGLALIGAAFICRPVFRVALAWVARTNSTDLFLPAVLLLALGTAFAGHLAGLSLPIGAFLAGVVVGESDFRHQVADDIRPFRDILLGLFFLTVGMEVNPLIVAAAPLAVLAWTVAFLPGKTLAMILVGAIMRWPPPLGARIAIILSHGGEDGLLLLTMAVRAGAIGPEVGQSALLALAATMALGPILIQQNAKVAQLVGGASHRLKEAAEGAVISEEGQGLGDHILLCGCGRVGRLVALVLEAAKVPYIAVEADLVRFQKAKKLGHKVVFGDASRKRVLEAAGVSRARLIVITFDQRRVVERLLHMARQENPTVSSIVSATDDQDVATLATAGAGTIFPENFAAGLTLADQVLLSCGFSQDDAAAFVTEVRAELNPELIGRVGI
jgi:CPA2 family monovalent cation:H+ antiporter-2